MTIVRPLPSGEIIEFDDDMPEDEIAAALRAYVRSRREATAIEVRTDAKASGGSHRSHPTAQGKQRIRRPSTEPGEDVSQDSSPAPAPEPVVSLRMCHIEPYVADENELTPEQRRERMQRAGRPARRDPPDDISDPFRDNMHVNWSKRYWRP